MEKKIKKISKDALIILLFTTITVFAWIGFDLLKAATKTVIPEVLQKQTEPLEPSFDSQTLDWLKSRRVFSQEELESVPEVLEFRVEPESSQEPFPQEEGKEASPSGQSSETLKM